MYIRTFVDEPHSRRVSQLFAISLSDLLFEQCSRAVSLALREASLRLCMRLSVRRENARNNERASREYLGPGAASIHLDLHNLVLDTRCRLQPMRKCVSTWRHMTPSYIKASSFALCGGSQQCCELNTWSVKIKIARRVWVVVAGTHLCENFAFV